MSHVIFSRNADNSVLSNNRIAQLAPAVFSTTQHERLTNRYVALHTSDVLPVMADYGYFPTQAAQKRSVKTNPAFSQHMIAFAKTNDIGTEGNGMRPEIILYNSHDGSGSVKLFAGAFRFICSNGIVAGDGFSSRIYHSKSLLAFEDMLRSTVETLPALMGKIDRLRSLSLESGQIHDMAIAAVATRWKDYTGQEDKGSYAVAQTVKDVMSAQRLEDRGYDAWTVFNKIQENVLRGNAFVRSITAAHPEGTMRKARSLSSIKQHVTINQELWNIAEEITA
jgi:hypothetical protein